MFHFIFDKAKDTEASKKTNYSISPYIKSFCTPQNSCLDKPLCVNQKEEKNKATKGDVNYLTDTGITWKKEYVSTTFITGTFSSRKNCFYFHSGLYQQNSRVFGFSKQNKEGKKVSMQIILSSQSSVPQGFQYFPRGNNLFHRH